MTSWENRIVGHGEEAPDQLVANPNNWRIHGQFQANALREVLGRVGWVGEVTVNETTGNVVDGHLRVAEAISTGQPTVPVRYVRLTEEEEAIVLATHDPISALASTDHMMLRQLVEDVQLGTGALSQTVSEILSDTPSAPPAPDPIDTGGGEGTEKVTENALQWGYTTFGGTKVGCSSGEIDALQQVYDDYVAEHGLDTGFVRWLADGQR
ncbi:MAG: hypothetical protein ACOYOQ_00260 [Microthrixaceae bacterium]